MTKVLLGCVNTDVLTWRQILRQASQYGRILDIYIQPAETAVSHGDTSNLPPRSVIIEYAREEEAILAHQKTNGAIWAGWRVQATVTSMPMP